MPHMLLSSHISPLVGCTPSASSHIAILRQDWPAMQRSNIRGTYFLHSSVGTIRLFYFSPMTLYPHGIPPGPTPPLALMRLCDIFTCSVRCTMYSCAISPETNDERRSPIVSRPRLCCLTESTRPPASLTSARIFSRSIPPRRSRRSPCQQTHTLTARSRTSVSISSSFACCSPLAADLSCSTYHETGRYPCPAQCISTSGSWLASSWPPDATRSQRPAASPGPLPSRSAQPLT